MTNARGPLVRMLVPVLAVLAGVVMYATWLAMARPAAFHGTAYEPAPAPDFQLRDVNGRPVTLASLRGAPMLLFFGYTHCPDLCPLTLDRLDHAIRDLGAKAGGARIVFVSVDPANDTPPVLRGYVARFGGRVTALTGDSAALASAWQGYGVYTIPGDHAAPVPAAAAHDHHAAAGRSTSGHAPMTHSGVVYGIDRAGNLRVIITEGAPEPSMRDDIRTLAKL